MAEYLKREMARGKERDGEYLYATSRIRAIAAGEDRDLLARILDAKTAGDAIRLLHNAEIGESVTDYADYEALFTSMLEEGYLNVLEITPDASDIDFLRYKYDCNNLKTTLKAKFRGFPFPEGLSSVGTVSPDRIIDALEDKRYDLLPKHMGEAAAEAAKAYAQTGDPQQIDFLLDRACAEDMADAAKDDFAKEYVSAWADLTNLMICLRLIRMKNGEIGKHLFERAYLPGGTLSETDLAELYDGGEDYFWEKIAYGPYSGLATQTSKSTAALSDVERAADNHLAALAAKTDYLAFGPAVLDAYLLRNEWWIKNIRIAIAGKLAELPTDVIRARLRTI